MELEKLSSLKKEELKEIAREKGLNTEGTKVELIEKISSASQKDTIRVECIQRYNDLQLNRFVEPGEQIEVTEERAKILTDNRVAKRL